MDGPLLMIKSGPVFFVEEVTMLLKRLARLLLCFGREFINRNIVVLDAFLLAQVDLHQAERRPLQRSYQFSGDIVPVSSVRVKETTSDGATRRMSMESHSPLLEALSSKSGCLPKTMPSPNLPNLKSGSSSSSRSSSPDAQLAPPSQSDISHSSATHPSDSSSTSDVIKASTTEKSDVSMAKPRRKRALSVITPKNRRSSLQVLSPVDKGDNQQTTPSSSLAVNPDQRSKRLSCEQLLASSEESEAQGEKEKEKGDDAGYEEAGEYIWSVLSFIKMNLSKFYTGLLKKDELVSRNTSLLRTVVTKVANEYRRVSKTFSSQDESCGPDPLNFVPGNRYSFESFASSYPSAANRTVYLLMFDSIIGYFAPATGKVHFERLEYPHNVVPGRGCKQSSSGKSDKGDSDKLSESKKDESSKGGSLLVRIHMLQKSDEYVFMSVSRECTINDMLEEICHSASELGNMLSASSPRSQSSPEGFTSVGSSNGKESPLTLPRASSGIVGGVLKRAKVVSATQSFWKELHELGKNATSEITSDLEPGHRRSTSYQFRLNSSLLALARLSQNSSSAGDIPFTPINQPRSAKVSSCFTQKELEYMTENSSICTGLYIYANSRVDDMTCSFAPRTLTPAAADFLQSLLGRKKGDSAPDLSPQNCLPALCELNAMFQSVHDLLPVSVEVHNIAPARGDPRRTAVPNSKLIAGAAQAPVAQRGRFNSLRTLFGRGKERKTNQIKNVSRSPVLLLVSQPFQVIPWESLLSDDVVLRYLSFFDVIQRSVLAERDPTELRVNEPVYRSLFYRATEQVVNTCEQARLKYQCDDLLCQLRVTVQTPEGSEDASVVGCFQSPLVEMTKRGIIISRKKYKYVEFIDLSTLSTSPEVFWDYFTVNHQRFPVIVVSYADVADPPKLLTTILRYRPSTAVIGVPSCQMKTIVQKLSAQHDAAIKQYQRTVTTKVTTEAGLTQYDRYQFLLSVVAAVRTESMAHISLLNCPLPLPSFALSLSS